MHCPRRRIHSGPVSSYMCFPFLFPVQNYSSCGIRIEVGNLCLGLFHKY